MGNENLEENKVTPPPAQGVRLEWQAVPSHVRAAVEDWLGSTVVSATSQPSGFSPGVAARLRTANDRRVFIKAIGPEPNPDSPSFHLREARISAQIPAAAPVPRLLWSSNDEESGWVVLLFEEISDGQHPAQPWRSDELARVLDTLASLARFLTPSPLPATTIGTASDHFAHQICGWQKLRTEQPAALDAWSVRHLDKLAEIERTAPAAVAGNTLLNLDVRADNMLLTPERVWFLDWPHAHVGAAWVDVIGFAPSVTMQGGPSPEEIIADFPPCQQADPAAITAAVVSIAGYFTYRSLQPPPPGIPTVRAFQAAQGAVAREWIAQRLGWT